MTETRPARRAALVYNPIKVDAAALKARVKRLAAAAGWGRVLMLETTVEDEGGGVTAQALEAKVDAVLVAGGDGTVRAVAAALRGSGVPLAIVPSGTGNLLARNLLLPLDNTDAMITAAFSGDRIPMDIGVATVTRPDHTVEEHGFVVMAGIGLDAEMVARTNPKLKKSVGWVAYVDGAARSLVTATPFRVLLQIEGHRLHSAKVQSVLFANCGALPAGIALIPDASINDGVLDVVLFQPTGWFGWIGVWRKVWWDNSVLRRSRAGRRVLERRGRDTSVHYMRGVAGEVAPATPQPIELDGDEFGVAARIRCHIEAGGLIAAVPAGHVLP